MHREAEIARPPPILDERDHAKMIGGAMAGGRRRHVREHDVGAAALERGLDPAKRVRLADIEGQRLDARDRLDFDQIHLPAFPVPAGETEVTYLERLVREGAKERYGDPLSDEVDERIRHELKVIEEMGFPAYFLIVWDLIRHAREAFKFQLTMAIATWLIGAIGVGLSCFLFGPVIWLAALIPWLASVAFGVLAGVSVNNRQDFAYPVTGEALVVR